MISYQHTRAISAIINEERKQWAKRHDYHPSLYSKDPLKALEAVAEGIAFHAEKGNQQFDIDKFLSDCGFPTRPLNTKEKT